MSTWNISEKLQLKILTIARNIEDNNSRILYLLRNLGPQRFTNLVEYSGLSRSTVSKYLKFHMKHNNIDKNFFQNESKNTQEQCYFITELGIEKLNEEPSKIKELYYFNELNRSISKLTDLIDFYKKIGIEESLIFQILKIILNIGENFFLIEQNPDLYLTLFYMFFNSVLTQDYKFELKAFCSHYNIKSVKIEFYVDKLMSSNLGFFMFARGDDMFFFHEEDILGTITLRLIKDRLLEELIHINRRGYKKIYDLDNIAEEISEKLLEMDLIWDRIKLPFEMLIEKIIIKTAKDMGISKIFLKDLAIQSEKLSKSQEGINSLIKIIEGSKNYEDLNIISIPKTKEVNLDDILGPIQGFCPNCGKIILEQDLSNRCSKCEENFKPEVLLKSIDSAKKISIQYKELVKEKLFKCPNPECIYYVKSTWDICPECLTTIKKEIV